MIVVACMRCVWEPEVITLMADIWCGGRDFTETVQRKSLVMVMRPLRRRRMS